VDGIDGVDAHAALDAETDLTAQGPCHVLLLMEVIRVLVDVAKPVNGVTGEVRGGRAKLFQLRVADGIKGGTHHVQGGLLQLIVSVDERTVVVEVFPQFAESHEVLFLRFCTVSVYLLLVGEARLFCGCRCHDFFLSLFLST
jgi:hypothetical protein